jgi:hypothetical protein
VWYRHGILEEFLHQRGGDFSQEETLDRGVFRRMMRLRQLRFCCCFRLVYLFFLLPFASSGTQLLATGSWPLAQNPAGLKL